MYRPRLSQWLNDVREGMPARTIPAPNDVERAMYAGPQLPLRSGADVISSSAAYALVAAQASHTRIPFSELQPLALMLVLSWDRVVVAPQTKTIERILERPCVPPRALLELACLPKQTYYVLIEHSVGDVFVLGVWLTLDNDPESGERVMRLLLEVVSGGQHLRDTVYEFVPRTGFYEAVEVQLSRLTARSGPACADSAPTEQLRQFLCEAAWLIAIVHDSLIVSAAEMEARLGAVPEDRCGFRLVCLGESLPQPLAVQ